MNTTTTINTEELSSIVTWFKSLTFEKAILTIVSIVVIVLIAMLLSRIVSKFIRRTLGRNDSRLPNESLFVNLARIVIWSIAIGLILSFSFGINITGLIAALGVFGLALSLGLETTVSNFVAGIQISLHKSITIGTHILVNDIKGVITDITWQRTTVTGFAGQKVVLPNNVFNSNAVTVLPPVRKIMVDAYLPFALIKATEGDTNDVEDMSNRFKLAATQALCDNAPNGCGLKIENEVAIYFLSMTDFGYKIRVVAWIEESEEFDKTLVEDAILRAISKTCKYE